MTAIVMALRSGVSGGDLMAMVAAAAAALESPAEQGSAKASAKALPSPRALTKTGTGSRAPDPAQVEIAQEVCSDSPHHMLLHQRDSAGCPTPYGCVIFFASNHLLHAICECRKSSMCHLGIQILKDSFEMSIEQ